MLLYQILAYTIHGKILKKSYKSNKFKIQHGIKNLNHLTDDILLQILKNILI